MIPIPGFWYRMSRGRRVMLLALVLLAAVLVALWLGFGAVSEEERVKGAVLEAVRAAEDESVDELAPTFSTQYRGAYGTDYQDLLARARRDFGLISDLRIRVTDWTIQIEGDRATVDLRYRFHLIYDKIGPYSNVPVNQLPKTPRGEAEKARLVLQREEGKWRIVELEAEIPPH